MPMAELPSHAQLPLLSSLRDMKLSPRTLHDSTLGQRSLSLPSLLLGHSGGEAS